MVSNKSFLGCCFLLFLLTACKKEKAINKIVESIQLNTSLNITEIEIRDSLDFWCSAGIRFGEGRLFHSTDAGINWSEALAHPQEINDFDFRNNELIVYPWGNKLLTSIDTAQNFSTTALPAWIYYSAGARTDHYTYLVAGENFGSGQILKLNQNTASTQLDTIQHELTDIYCWNDSSCIATGYGVILKTIDGGENWLPDDARGDFYKAIDFADEQTAYVVGDYGSIWKTTNQGEDWTKIRSASTFMNNRSRFTDACFRSPNEGAIVGKNGLCWLTYNGGQSWVPVKDLTELDFFTVSIANGRVYIGAEHGMIYHFEF